MQYLFKSGVSWWCVLCSSIFSIVYLLGSFGTSDAQSQQSISTSMPQNYLPKEYFFADGRRDPRHIQIQPSSSSGINFFNPSISNSPRVSIVSSGGDSNPSASTTNGITTTTYHLNPQEQQNFNNFNRLNSNYNSNPHNFNSDHSLNQNNNPSGFNNGDSFITSSLEQDNNNNQFGTKILQKSSTSSSSSSGSKRLRRRLMKVRRLPKAFRPPKEFIIYSLPEQSFWSHHNPIEDPLISTPSDPNDLREDSELDDSSEENNSTEILSKKDFKLTTAESDQAESTTAKSSTVSVNDEEDSPILKQKKTLLGQCMKHCIDALL